MTFASIAIALPLAAVLAASLGWLFTRYRFDPTLAALWACSLGIFFGIAALLSDGPAGMMRAVWPREAVDWLAVAAGLLTTVAAFQTRPVALGRITLVLGVLLGILIVCRLMYGSVYLRPGNTPTSSLLAIALAGALLGLCYHVELARKTERPVVEAFVCGAVGLGAAATLGMSGSMQYAMIGVLVTVSAVAAWISTRCWPWVSNLVILMLLGLGMAFADLQLLTMLGLTSAVLICSLIGFRPEPHTASKSLIRSRVLALVAVIGVVVFCVGWNAQQFLKEVKGNNSSNGGYEAYK